jgi:hypothetical protein
MCLHFSPEPLTPQDTVYERYSPQTAIAKTSAQAVRLIKLSSQCALSRKKVKKATVVAIMAMRMARTMVYACK